MRKAHVLKPTKGDDRPSHLIALAVHTRRDFDNTSEFRRVLVAGHAIYSRTRRGDRLRPQSSVAFTDPSEFWRWTGRIVGKRQRLYLVGRGLHVILPALDAFSTLASLDYSLEQFYSQGDTNVFRWRREGSQLIAADLINFYRDAPQASADLNLPVLSAGEAGELSPDEVQDQCAHDAEGVRSLMLAWLQFLDDHNLGAFRLTVAGTALEAYRHRFMPRAILVHDDKAALELEGEALYGGRTEVLFQGRREHDTYTYLDRVGAYGSVMRDHLYPAWLWGVRGETTIPFLADRLSKTCVIARVVIETDENAYPVRRDGWAYYPTGRFTTTLATPELQYAVEHGHVKRVLKIAWYRPAPLFADYVETLWQLRQRYEREGNSAMWLITKLLTNSLHGKFSQRQFDQQNKGSCDPWLVRHEWVKDRVTGAIGERHYVGGSIMESWRFGWSYNAIPSIAAHVTAYGRMQLWRAMQQVPRRHLYYVDTDALFVDSLGYEKLSDTVDPGALGALKVKGESDWLEIRAPKDYSMAGHETIKGIAPDAQRVGRSRYVQTEDYRIPGLIAKGTLRQPLGRIVLRILDRQIRGGVVGADGFVAPRVLVERD